jgi:hypothetical protein
MRAAWLSGPSGCQPITGYRISATSVQCVSAHSQRREEGERERAKEEADREGGDVARKGRIKNRERERERKRMRQADRQAWREEKGEVGGETRTSIASTCKHSTTLHHSLLPLHHSVLPCTTPYCPAPLPTALHHSLLPLHHSVLPCTTPYCPAPLPTALHHSLLPLQHLSMTFSQRRRRRNSPFPTLSYIQCLVLLSYTQYITIIFK